MRTRRHQRERLSAITNFWEWNGISAWKTWDRSVRALLGGREGLGLLELSSGAMEAVFKTFLACLAFMVIGPSLMLLNKELLTEFPFPFLLSSLGLVFSSAVTHAMKSAGQLELAQAEIVTKKFYFTRVLPVGACHAATLAFGNSQYLYMGVALIQFLKAFTPMIVTLTGYFILGRKASTEIWVALMIACFGTSMTAAGDMSAEPFGFLLAAGSSITEAIRLVLTQFALQDCKFTLLEGQYFLAPAGAACLLTLSLFWEAPQLLATNGLSVVFKRPFDFMLAGSLGLGVQLVTSAVIQLTNSVTVKVLSQFRNALVVLAGVFVYSEQVSTVQLFGYLIAVSGIIRYGFLQSQLGQKNPNPTQPQPAKSAGYNPV